MGKRCMYQIGIHMWRKYTDMLFIYNYLLQTQIEEFKSSANEGLQIQNLESPIYRLSASIHNVQLSTL